MKRVLVTGATGFTGRYLVPALEADGLEVRGLSHDQCDIRDAAAVREAVRAADPRLVVHLAGTPSLPDSERETLFAVNAGGTANLLAALAALPQIPERVVLASSCYVYGDTGGVPAVEDALPNPIAEYGRSKLEMEQVARGWTGRLPIVIARPFNYTGVGHGARFLVPKLVKVFKAGGDDASFVQADVVRDFLDVRDVASAYVRLIRHGVAGAAYNICTGVAMPLGRLVELLESITGHKVMKRPTGGARGSLVGAPTRMQEHCHWAPLTPLRGTLEWMLAAA